MGLWKTFGAAGLQHLWVPSLAKAARLGGTRRASEEVGPSSDEHVLWIWWISDQVAVPSAHFPEELWLRRHEAFPSNDSLV
jgi:hypothetical protein